MPHPMDIYAEPQRLISVGGRPFNMHVTGEGGQTVVLAAGFLGLTLDWILVQHALSRQARVVSFDNAGLGFSAPGPEPRSTHAIVKDLRAALVEADLPPPYLFVGHSAGSLRTRLFAALHPEEAVGLVQVDPVTADWQRRVYGGTSSGMDEEVALAACLLRLAERGQLTASTPQLIARLGLPRTDLTPAVTDALVRMWLRPSYLRTVISEAEGLRTAEVDACEADRPLGDLPIVVLSAGRIEQSPITNGDPRKVAAWRAMHDAIAAQSSRGQVRTVDAGHNIPIEAPAAVVSAVQDVLAGR